MTPKSFTNFSESLTIGDIEHTDSIEVARNCCSRKTFYKLCWKQCIQITFSVTFCGILHNKIWAYFYLYPLCRTFVPHCRPIPRTFWKWGDLYPHFLSSYGGTAYAHSSVDIDASSITLDIHTFYPYSQAVFTAGVYLDFLPRGMVAMLGGSRPYPFCKSAIVSLYVLHSTLLTVLA